MELASWHYQEELFDAASPSANNIRMLQPSPAWAIGVHTTADWVDKQRMRQELGLTKTSRKDRRRKRIMTGKHGEESEDMKPYAKPAGLSTEEYLEKYKRSMAVIASGQGPYGAKEHEIFRKRLKLAMRGAVVVGLSAIVIGVLRQNPSGKEMEVILEEFSVVPKKEESLVENRVPINVSSESATCDVLLDLPVIKQETTIPLTDKAKQATFKPVVAFTVKTLNNKDAASGSKPALPDTLTPANLFPSPNSMRQVEPKPAEKPDQVLTKAWNQELKKVTMLIYRYLYQWTSKLILKPIRFLKKFWKQLQE